MAELTENQKKVIDAIQSGQNTIDAIVGTSELSKSKVTGTITSLSKKQLIIKNQDGSYSLPALEAQVAQDINPSEELSESTVLPVLIPYLKSEAAGEELKYALRSLVENLKTDFRVIVVGDKEDWFSPEIVHIPLEVHLVKEVCDCPAPSMIRNPQADVTHKIFTAIASGEIQDDFILSNDDIFLLAPTYPVDIEVLKAFGVLDKGGKDGGLYNQNIKQTAKALENNQLPNHRYGTHTPMKMNAKKLIEIIEKYNALEKGYLLTSLYFNEVYPEARPIQLDGSINDKILSSVYRTDVSDSLMKELIQTRKFMNCNFKGWVSVKPHLEALFPNPSRYEL